MFAGSGRGRTGVLIPRFLLRVETSIYTLKQNQHGPRNMAQYESLPRGVHYVDSPWMKFGGHDSNLVGLVTILVLAMEFLEICCKVHYDE